MRSTASGIPWDEVKQGSVRGLMGRLYISRVPRLRSREIRGESDGRFRRDEASGAAAKRAGRLAWSGLKYPRDNQRATMRAAAVPGWAMGIWVVLSQVRNPDCLGRQSGRLARGRGGGGVVCWRAVWW